MRLRRKAKKIILKDGTKITPFSLGKAPSLPKGMLLVSAIIADEIVYPGHTDFYTHPEIGPIQATYHGSMPNGDVIITIQPVQYITN